MNIWVVICPGLSMADVSADWMQDYVRNLRARCVAVNGAIVRYHACADWWAVMDYNAYTNAMKQTQPADIKRLWTCDNIIAKEQIYAKEYFEIKGECPPPTISIPRMTFNKNNLVNLIRNGGTIPWDSRTMNTAIALAVLHGAQYIEMHGADMGGQGYFDVGLSAYSDAEQHANYFHGLDHSDRRWERELQEFKQIKFWCKTNGIKIKRIGARNEQ